MPVVRETSARLTRVARRVASSARSRGRAAMASMVVSSRTSRSRAPGTAEGRRVTRKACPPDGVEEALPALLHLPLGQGPERKDLHPTDEGASHPRDQPDVRRSRQKEAAGPPVPVHRRLERQEQVGDPLDLVDHDQPFLPADEGRRVGLGRSPERGIVGGAPPRSATGVSVRAFLSEPSMPLRSMGILYPSHGYFLPVSRVFSTRLVGPYPPPETACMIVITSPGASGRSRLPSQRVLSSLWKQRTCWRNAPLSSKRWILSAGYCRTNSSSAPASVSASMGSVLAPPTTPARRLGSATVTCGIGARRQTPSRRGRAAASPAAPARSGRRRAG